MRQSPSEPSAASSSRECQVRSGLPRLTIIPVRDFARVKVDRQLSDKSMERFGLVTVRSGPTVLQLSTGNAADSVRSSTKSDSRSGRKFPVIVAFTRGSPRAIVLRRGIEHSPVVASSGSFATVLRRRSRGTPGQKPIEEPGLRGACDTCAITLLENCREFAARRRESRLSLPRAPRNRERGTTLAIKEIRRNHDLRSNPRADSCTNE